MIPFCILSYVLFQSGRISQPLNRFLSVLGIEDQQLTALVGEPPETSPTLTPEPSPTGIPNTISVIYAPGEVEEGSVATFTWDISGPATVIHKTAVYFGITTSSSSLPYVAPEETRYTDVVRDFFEGDYSLPMRFVANTKEMEPGTYFYRIYARIGDKHLWTDEKTFIVKQAPKHEIKVVHYPQRITQETQSAFTWEIYGPDASTGFTAIVAGKDSQPGPLSMSTPASQTPYGKVIVSEFTSGTFQVPLRFIGNASALDPGEYFFRAVALINGKNIWSDEYSFTVGE